jgi:hypothetical protein
MTISINDLKKHLGPGLGLRKNRYMLELPVPLINGSMMNVLCQSAGLPERNINVTEMWHKGRRYVVRGETDYISEYEISIVDDSKMEIRQMFDTWLALVDDSRPNPMHPEGSYEIDISNRIQNFASKFPGDKSCRYQLDINIWQMDRKNNPVYGYKLQNAFPKSVGIVTLEDGDENTLSEFSVTFAFSEFLPLHGKEPEIIKESFDLNTNTNRNDVFLGNNFNSTILDFNALSKSLPQDNEPKQGASDTFYDP